MLVFIILAGLSNWKKELADPGYSSSQCPTGLAFFQSVGRSVVGILQSQARSRAGVKCESSIIN